MRDFSVHKKYAIFTVILCGVITLLGFLTPLIPRSGTIYPMKITDSEKVFWIYSFLISIIFSILPTTASLIGFYIYGALGSSKATRNVLCLFIFSLTLTVALISICLLGNKVESFDGFILSYPLRPFQNTATLLYLNTFVQIFVFPILFTILALSAKTVSLWQRFLPIISLILSIVIPILVSVTIFYTYKYLGSSGDVLYHITTEATISQWLMIGSIAWTLVGLSVSPKVETVK